MKENKLMGKINLNIKLYHTREIGGQFVPCYGLVCEAKQSNFVNSTSL